jgi:hypothetical protein
MDRHGIVFPCHLNLSRLRASRTDLPPVAVCLETVLLLANMIGQVFG